MNSQKNLYSIGRYLAWFESQIWFENSRGSFDINKYAEPFMIPILNPIFKANFQLLENEKKNMSSVDIGDKNLRIAYQITSEDGPGKVRETIKKFVNKGHYKNYESLYFILLSRKRNYRPKLEENEIEELIESVKKENNIKQNIELNFDVKEHYWTLTTLNDQIKIKCSNPEYETIVEHLESEYPEVRSLPTFDDILIPYQIAFKKQLDETDKALSNKFTNKFFGREKELDDFAKFIKSKDSLLAVVAGGGFGKTRLCIEAFQKFIDPIEDLEAFSLNEGAYRYLDQVQNLNVDRTTIILIDDAHKRPDILNDLISTANRLPNMKLVLTIRHAVYDQTIKHISTHLRDIIPIKLSRLEYEVTQKVLKSVLPRLKEQEIKRLADKSRGVPGVILSMANLAMKGKVLDRLSEEESFVLYVNELKEQAIDDVYVRTFIDKEKINRTIQSISFFGPITNNDEELKLISLINKLDFEETTQIISLLESIDFIKNDGFISIKPDPYSDVILIEASTRLKFLLEFPGIEKLKDRLLTNLVSVDYSKKIKFDIDGLLINFIKSVTSKKFENDSEIKTLQRNLDTISSFTYKKPRLSFLALENLFAHIENIGVIWQKIPNYNNYYHKDLHDKIDLIYSIAFLNTQKEADLENAFITVLKYIKSRQSNDLLNTCFRYRIYDFHEYGYHPVKPFHRQFFLLDNLEKKFTNDFIDEHSGKFLFDGLKLLLNLEFDGESYYDKFTSSLSYGRAAVIKNDNTAIIRNRATHLFIKVFNHVRHTELASNILDELLRMIFYVSKSRGLTNNYEFDQSDEVNMVTKFVNDLLCDSPSIDERGQILRKLKLFKRKEIKAVYQQGIDDLIELANTVRDLKDRLSLLFLDEHFYLRENLNSEFISLVNEYESWEVLIDDLIDIQSELDSKNVYHYKELINVIESEYPEKAKTTIDYVKNNHPDHIMNFSFLVRVNYTEVNYFYEFIDYLWNLDRDESQPRVIWLLTYGRKQDLEYYDKRDFNYINEVVSAKNIEAISNLTFTIHKYILIDVATTLGIIGKILEIELHQHNHDHIIHSLFEDDTITKKFRDELKGFAFKRTMSLSFDNLYLSELLTFLDTEFGFDVLLDYLIQKIDRIKADEGNFFHLYIGSPYTNKNKSDYERENDFLSTIDWFVKQDLENSYENEKLLEYIKPPSQFTESLKKKVLEFIDDKPLDDLIKTAIAVNVYDDKNEELVRTLIGICHEAIKSPHFERSSLSKILDSSIIYNHGTKSGLPGHPFPQDLERKDLLEKILVENSLQVAVREILDSALDKVIKDIEDAKDLGPHEKW